MNKNRQQLKTGLRAILAGGLRDEPVAPEIDESHDAAEHLVVAKEITKTVVIPAEPVNHVALADTEPKEVKIVEEDEPREEPRAAVAAPEEPARKPRKKAAPPPPPEPKKSLSAAVRVGTLDNPYVRKRDNLPTRKVGIVLPVALAERMQIHCVKARTRPNEFVARAIEALLDELQA